MIGKDSQEELEAYRPWSYIAGLLLAVALFVLMFALADGF